MAGRRRYLELEARCDADADGQDKEQLMCIVKKINLKN